MNFALSFRKTPKVKKGFSLVEISIVIAIMAIAALVAIPGMLSYMRKAKFSTTQQTLETTKTAIMSYYGDVLDYPKTLEDLIEKPADVPSRKWHGPYFEKAKLPKDGWNHELEYNLTSKGAHPYELYSWGPNGVDSSEDNISVWELD